MNNKISNPKPDLKTGLSLNEKDIMMSLLTCLKEMTKNYACALTEASNEKLYNKHLNMFVNISKMQREVFEKTFSLGLYELEKTDKQKIASELNTLSGDYNSLN